MADKPQKEYQLALEAWKARDLDACLEHLSKVKRKSEYDRAIVLELKSWVCATRGDYAEQMRLLEQAWPHARASGNQKVCAYILHAWSILARDLYRVDGSHWDPYLVTTFDWREYKLQRFHALRAVAQVSWFEGHWEQAYRYFLQAAEVCPSEAWRVTLLLDRALLSEVQGDVCHAKAYAAHAADIASKIDWNETPGEERIGLLTLAKYPPHTEFYDVYRKIRTPMESSICSAGRDLRQTARVMGAHGRALLAKGHQLDGLAELDRAFSLWAQLGVRWRAALCDIDIATISNLTPGYALALHKELRSPWIDKLVEPFLPKLPSFTEQLRKSELDVLDLLCQGMSNCEIGKQLCRSPHTVRNQIARISDILGASSRMEVVSIAFKSGFR